ncbi:uncharacterized protein V5649_012480 [Rhynchonycteris naso]
MPTQNKTKGERERGRARSEPTQRKIRIRLSPAPARSRCHRGEASIPTMTLASHPGATRHHQCSRRQRPPPLHHSRRRSCQEGAGSGRRRRAPGRPEPGTEDRGPTAGTAMAAAAGALSPRSHPPRAAAGRGRLSGRMSSSLPRSSPWGSSAEASETGGKGGLPGTQILLPGQV